MRYRAHITAEAWIRDQAIEVDAPGPQEWDCTAFALLHERYLDEQAAYRGERDGEVLDSGDLFASDPDAPAWVREWRGPFTIRITRITKGS